MNANYDQKCIDLSITKIENNLSYDNSFFDQSFIETFYPDESKDQNNLKMKINQLVNLPSLGHDELIKLDFIIPNSLNGNGGGFNQFSDISMSIGVINNSNINIRCIQNNTLETARFDARDNDIDHDIGLLKNGGGKEGRSGGLKKLQLESNIKYIIKIQSIIRKQRERKIYISKLKSIKVIQKQFKHLILKKRSKKLLKYAINQRLSQFKSELEQQLNNQQNLFKKKIIDYKTQKNLQINFDSILSFTHNKINKVFNTSKNIINLKILSQKQLFNNKKDFLNDKILQNLKSNSKNDKELSIINNDYYHSQQSYQTNSSNNSKKVNIDHNLLNHQPKTDKKIKSILHSFEHVDCESIPSSPQDNYKNQNIKQQESNQLSKDQYIRKDNKINESNIKQEPEINIKQNYLSNDQQSKGLTVRSSTEKDDNKIYKNSPISKSPIKLELEEKIKSFNSQIKNANNLENKIKSQKDHIKEEIINIKKSKTNQSDKPRKRESDLSNNMLNCQKEQERLIHDKDSNKKEIEKERNQVSKIILKDNSNFSKYKSHENLKIKSKYQQKSIDCSDKKSDKKSDKNKIIDNQTKDQNRKSQNPKEQKHPGEIYIKENKSPISNIKEENKYKQDSVENDDGDRSNRKLKNMFADKQLDKEHAIKVQSSRNSSRNSRESLDDKKRVDKQLNKDPVEESNMNCSLSQIQNELRELNNQFKTSRSFVNDVENPPQRNQMSNDENRPKLSPMMKKKLSNGNLKSNRKVKQ